MSAELIEQIESGLKEARSLAFSYEWLVNIERDLRHTWELPEKPRFSVAAERDAPKYQAENSQSQRPPPWLIGITSGFQENTARIDKIIKGRVFEAITDLSSNQLELRGDTLKPLTAEFKGCWRYRIGGYRLIFEPDRHSGKITLLAFLPRGAAYD